MTLSTSGIQSAPDMIGEVRQSITLTILVSDQF